jgi:polysaccharide export outer membrane protein
MSWLGRWIFLSGSILALLQTGCVSRHQPLGAEPAPYLVNRNGQPVTNYFADPRYDGSLPREIQKVTMPEYRVEIPDILRVELLRVSPTPQYKVDGGDILFVSISYKNQPDPFAVEALVTPDGVINLPITYGGSVRVAGLTTEQIEQAIVKAAEAKDVKEPKVQVNILQSRALTALRGEYIISQDGKINLGVYGRVRVVGLTLEETKQTIETHLSQFLNNPIVSVDVAAYNSKVYYVIFDGGGRGQQIYRLPITGNETVLDAIANVQGLPQVSSKYHMWVARPAPASVDEEMILPVDWVGISSGALTKTNYQLLPGDRLYVRANPLVTLDNYLSFITTPAERVFGSILVAQTSIQAVQNRGQFATIGR